ncbi:hybrid sensor histidine kinase/response regulator, partial [Beijerinckia sp. L45]|uniref:hybrid sensor histidine kinase/response regulator n=1 Tax=Beijerinckia sp. L45 TaxID=1641855 RepID=UPI001AED9429
PTIALLAMSIVLPLLLFGLAAWQNRHDVVREAETRVERTTRILHEHALKVFEMHQLMINHINERLHSLDWSDPADIFDMHQLLAQLARDTRQVSTITITDAEGHATVSSRAYPVDPTINLADLDYFQALKAHEQALPFVSHAVIGRQSGEPVFNIAQRLWSREPGTFGGIVTISVRRAYFEDFYREIEQEYDHLVILTRDDGSVLASEPRNSMTRLPSNSLFRQALENPSNGLLLTPSVLDGTKRIFGYEKIGSYPVVIGFGVTWNAALAPWWRNIMGYGLVAFLSSLALLGVSGIAMRHSVLEEKATRSWRETAALLQGEMTERQRVEEQLRQAQKMEAIGRLTGGVAHDFNNLLTIVIGSLDLLSRRMRDADPRHQALVRNAVDGATRAAALTARLLAFSRQHPLDPKPIDANALIAGMSNMMERSLGETVAVEVVLAAGLWTTFADPNQLENALINLSVNALDAMPDGGKLTIETANATLDPGYVARHADLVAGAYVMVSVTDSGTGMSLETVARAFDPFYTTKPVGKGTGLGLSQVYGFTKQSGGHTSIYSEIGHGTSIKLYLPRFTGRRPVDVAAVEAVVEGPALQPVDTTILIVEDDDLVRRFSSAALRESGYKVLEASSGAEGLRQVEAHAEIALLFTDVVLGGTMNGRELAERAVVLRPALPVLFTTGYTKNAIIHQGKLDEGVNFLGKPFTTAALAAKIEALLRTHA